MWARIMVTRNDINSLWWIYHICKKPNLESLQITSKHAVMGKTDVAEAEEHLDTFQM